MKDLKFILERINQRELADMLGLTGANVTTWKITKSVPKKQALRLKTIKEELKNEPKRRTLLS